MVDVNKDILIDSLHEDINAGIKHMKMEMRKFIRHIRNTPTPEYLTSSSSQFSAKLTLHSIIQDATSSLKTSIATMFNKNVDSRPVHSHWLIFHIAESLALQTIDISSRRHFFHIPTNSGFLVVYLDEKIMVNGRQIIYLCLTENANVNSDENSKPMIVELFRRGAGLQDPDHVSLRCSIYNNISRFV